MEDMDDFVDTLVVLMLLAEILCLPLIPFEFTRDPEDCVDLDDTLFTLLNFFRAYVVSSLDFLGKSFEFDVVVA